jgi:hypothetical protein
MKRDQKALHVVEKKLTVTALSVDQINDLNRRIGVLKAIFEAINLSTSSDLELSQEALSWLTSEGFDHFEVMHSIINGDDRKTEAV